MQTSVLRALVNNPFWKSFDIIFMINEKKTVKILMALFSFSIKIIFKLIISQYLKGIR